ncbi:MAG: metallophosphoesterase family protein [Aestuariivirga sp.]|nr:metallophosphoesterase family protein [Aestuariivirga sp.]
MRIALISDVHANLPALEACLAAAERRAVDRLAFLGDFVGYGPDPEAVIDRVRPLAEAGAIAVLGNHDLAVLKPTRDMNPTAAKALAWTRTQLSEESKSFLAGLPFEVRSGDLLFVHSEASDPAAWHYVTDAETARASLMGSQATVTFCGHVHVPAVYCLSATGKMTAHSPVQDVATPFPAQRKWLAVIGSAGQPRDGNPAASFAIYDTDQRTLTYHRAPYDVEGVSQRIRALGLPDQLADRLLRGR